MLLSQTSPVLLLSGRSLRPGLNPEWRVHLWPESCNWFLINVHLIITCSVWFLLITITVCATRHRLHPPGLCRCRVVTATASIKAWEKWSKMTSHWPRRTRGLGLVLPPASPSPSGPETLELPQDSNLMSAGKHTVTLSHISSLSRSCLLLLFARLGHLLDKKTQQKNHQAATEQRTITKSLAQTNDTSNLYVHTKSMKDLGQAREKSTTGWRFVSFFTLKTVLISWNLDIKDEIKRKKGEILRRIKKMKYYIDSPAVRERCCSCLCELAGHILMLLSFTDSAHRRRCDCASHVHIVDLSFYWILPRKTWEVDFCDLDLWSIKVTNWIPGSDSQCKNGH